MNKFYMLAGLPDSGKSYLAERLAEKGAVWISSDAVRKELYGSESVQGNTEDIFGTMKSRTIKALRAGQDVVYDACNINSKKRTAFLNDIRKLPCWKVCVICAVPYEMCLKRNTERDRHVPAYAIIRMYKSWHTPAYYEGWDEIRISYAEGARGCAGTPEEYVQGLMDYPQETPYHQETLGIHMQDVRDRLVSEGVCGADSNLAAAALIHDCGKPFTKTFSDKKGGKSDAAHFYGHENTGAYDSLFFRIPGKDAGDMLEISILVMLHMRPFSWRDEEKNDKQKALWGGSLYEKVLALHRADKASAVKG